MSAYNVGLKFDLELIANGNDSTPAGLNFTEHGTIVYSSDGAYCHDDMGMPGEYLTHAANAAFYLDPTGWFGMVEVLFHSKDPNPNLNQVLLAFTPEGGDNVWGLVYIQDLNKAYFFEQSATGDYFGPMVDMPADPTLTRHFFFFWLEPSVHKMWLQVDNGTPVSDTYAGAFSTHPTSVMYVGADGNTPGSKQCDADIRHFRIWAGSCIAFSAGDISGLYNGGAGIPYASIVGSGITPCSSPLEPAAGWKFSVGVGQDYF